MQICDEAQVKKSSRKHTNYSLSPRGANKEGSFIQKQDILEFIITVNQPDYRTDDDYRSKIANIGKI